MIIVAASILVYGRAFEILVYEWDYDKAHLSQLLSYWRGGRRFTAFSWEALSECG